MKKNLTTTICIIGLLTIILVKYSHIFSSKNTPANTVATTTITSFIPDITGKDIQVKKYSDLPDYVKQTVDYLKQNNFTQPESGYVGGRIFTNYEKSLPWSGASYYHEWDVHPKIQGVNRGTERLVTGEKDEIYFTNTHYGNSGSPAFYLVQF